MVIPDHDCVRISRGISFFNQARVSVHLLLIDTVVLNEHQDSTAALAVLKHALIVISDHDYEKSKTDDYTRG